MLLIMCAWWQQVDECQDMSRQQYEVLKLLTQGGKYARVTMVGDVNQAVYAFRNADKAIFQVQC